MEENVQRSCGWSCGRPLLVLLLRHQGPQLLKQVGDLGGRVNLLSLLQFTFSKTPFGLLVFGEVTAEDLGPTDVAGDPLRNQTPHWPTQRRSSVPPLGRRGRNPMGPPSPLAELG